MMRQAAATNNSVPCVLSILKRAWTNPGPIIDEVFTEKGIRLTTVKVPSEAEDFFVDVRNSMKCKRTEIMIYHEYFIL